MPEQQPQSAALQIPSEFIRPIIQEKINLAIIDALKGKESLVAEAVKAILETRVGWDGNIPQYGGRGDQTWVEYKVKDAIKKAAEVAIIDTVKALEPNIRDMIAKQLTAKKSPLLNALVEKMTQSVIQAASSSYSLKLTVEAPVAK